MLKYISCLTILLSATLTFGQTIKRIDDTSLSVDSVQRKIDYLMKTANDTGIAVSIFNDNKPVFSETFGFANVPGKEVLTQNSIMYAASFAKMVFAYFAMQFVQDNLIDLDKPLYEYLDKPLTEYKIQCWNRGYQDLQNDDRYREITARMCLTHTTGF